MTPYDQHEQQGHRTTRYSPNGVDIIEECDDCGARWLHNPCIGYPVSLRPFVRIGSVWVHADGFEAMIGGAP